VIGEILGGIILGPSVLGQSNKWMTNIWPENDKIKSIDTFGVISNVGLIFFMCKKQRDMDK
jgi:Kef-type K+ transport system membrane component KefB